MANSYYNRAAAFAPRTKAKSEDVTSELDAISAGFDQFPTPVGDGTGFIDPVRVGTATNTAHAVTKAQLDAEIASNEQNRLDALAAQSAAEAAQGLSEDAQGLAEDARDAAELSAVRAENALPEGSINDETPLPLRVYSSEKTQALIDATANFRNMEVFGSSGIFDLPPGRYFIEGYGAGSGGGQLRAGSGGGSFRGFIDTTGDLVITIGTGGLGTTSADGNPGGNTSITGEGINIIGFGGNASGGGDALMNDGLEIPGTQGEYSESADSVLRKGGSTAFINGARLASLSGPDGMTHTGAGGGNSPNGTGGRGAHGKVIIMW